MFNIIKTYSDGKEVLLEQAETKEKARQVRQEYINFFGTEQDIEIVEV